MPELKLSELEQKLFAMTGSRVVIWDGMVNMDDLFASFRRPGGVIRVKDDVSKCIQILLDNTETVGCVAGWVSEDDG